MSHSPIRAAGSDGSDTAESFLEAHKQLTLLLRSGMSWSGHERNCAFLNTGTGLFADISAVSGFDFLDDGRATATADWDFDGKVDVWVANRTGPQIRFLRNNVVTKNHYLAVRLKGNGRGTSRDAIGARVELISGIDSGKKYVKTLHAGDGYLSQSSRWLHFGLGQKEKIDRLIVRWPGGGAEEFVGLMADQHYEIVQDSGKALPWSPPKRTIRITPVSQPQKFSSASRTLFLARFQVPPVDYTDSEGSAASLTDHIGKLLLVNLWASWCQPCVTELAELTEYESELRKAGVDVLAINVENVTGDEQLQPADVRRFLRERKFPFQGGLVSKPSMERLDAFVAAMFVQSSSLPLPTSLLLDSQGRAAVLYRGPVSAADVLADIRLLQIEDTNELYRLALPFPGREYGRPQPITLADLVHEFIKWERIDNAKFYMDLLRKDATQWSNPIVRASFAEAHYDIAVHYLNKGDKSAAILHYRKALSANPELRDAHYNLAVLLAEGGQTESAIVHYREALRITPDYFKAHNNLGKIYAESGDAEAAITHYRQALLHVPESVDTLNNLGNALVALGQATEAVTHFEKAISINEADARSHYNHGAALGSLGRYDDAIIAYQRCVALNPDHMLAHNNLGTALARMKRYQEAEKHLRKAIALDPDYQPAKRNLRLLKSLREQSP